jgi:putative heme transporter
MSGSECEASLSTRANGLMIERSVRALDLLLREATMTTTTTATTSTITTDATGETPPVSAAHGLVDFVRRHRRVIGGLFSLALIVAIFYGVLPKVADFSSVRAEIAEMTWIELCTLTAAAMWNLVTYWFVVKASLPGATIGQAMIATEASTAVSNTVPAGGAIGMGITFRMFRSWGFKRSAVTLSMLTSGIWNNFAKLALPVLALSLLALQGAATPSRVVAGFVGLAALAVAIGSFALALRRETVAWRAGELAAAVVRPIRRALRMGPPHEWGDTVVRYRNRMIELLSRRWYWLTLWTVVGHLSLFLVLLLTMRHVGISPSEVSVIEALAAFAFTRLVTAIPFTPGGLGVVELALTAALVTAGGAREQVVASVLVFRALTYLVPIGIGALSFLHWRRQVAIGHASSL